MFERLITRLTILAICVAAGCGDAGGDSGGDAGPTYVDDFLELRTDSRVIESDVRDEALISSDAEAGEYVFDATALRASGVTIEAGNVLLIAEQALIRVTSATALGGELVVNGDPATLPELVDGELSWSLGLDGADETLPTLLIGDQEVEGVRKLNSLQYSADVNGFKVGVSFTPVSARNEISFEVTIQRGVEPAVKLRAKATGKVSGFRHELETAMAGGQTSSFNYFIHNLDAQLKIEVAGSNADVIALKHVLPKAFVLRVPIPTALPLGLNFQFSIGLDAEITLPTLANAATQVSADFRYSGSTGFEFGGTTVQPGGNGGSGTAEPSGPNTTAAGGEAGIVLKVIPFFSLNALLDQAKAELQIQNNIGGSFEGDGIRGVCSTTSIASIVKGVLTAKWFGIPLASLDHEFYRKEAHLEHGHCRD